MDIKAFEYVNAIVEYGSISKAAETLYISQPALSQYLKNLESELGTKLFIRDGTRLILTAAGETFIKSGNVILRSYKTMCSQISDSKEKKIINIRIGMSPFYAKFYMPMI